MAFIRGANVVTDGLVLALDAANPKSYVSGSTTWRDLSGTTVTGSLVNGPTFSSANGGSIVFDGVDDRVSRDLAVNSGDNFTVSAWIYPTLLGITRRTIIGNAYNYSARNGWLFSVGSGGGADDAFFLTIGQDLAYKIASANTLSLNTWANVVATCSGGGLDIGLYKNGIAVNTYLSLLSSGTISYSYNQFNLGFRNYLLNADPYTGNIASVQIYNRALSPTEVLQNYNATKARFGIE